MYREVGGLLWGGRQVVEGLGFRVQEDTATGRSTKTDSKLE
jgi:hypothetical protein